MLELVIANKAYSSWSFRPWILLRHFGIAFSETQIPLSTPDTATAIRRHSPAGKVPILRDGPITIWESLAIVEYVAEMRPDLAIWPRDKAARALARALSCEMHAGFSALRNAMPMNTRRAVRRREASAEVAADIGRIDEAWADARQKFGGAGPFLFGDFSAADAMFAPVVSRLHVYDAAVSHTSKDYMAAVMALPAWKAWMAEAAAEPMVVAKYEADLS